MKRLIRSIPFLLFVMIAALSCQQLSDLAGRYEAEHPVHQGSMVMLTLETDGKGSWTVDNEEVPFRWERKGGEIWLHSRQGGVIRGGMEDARSIAIDLPGVGALLFKRIRQ